MIKTIRPYNLLGVGGLLLFVVSFLVPLQTVDIQMFDTYFVFDMSYAFRNIACFLLVLFTLYTFLKHKFHSTTLSWLHAGLTILTIAAIILFLYKASNAYQPGFSDWSTFQTNNKVIVITIFVFALAQVLMVINLVIGVIKSRKS